MEHNYHTISLAFFVVILCAVEFVEASVVTVEKSLAEETYSQLGFEKTITSTTIQDTSSHMRRSIQEKGDDVCAGPGWQMAKQGESPCPTLVVWVPKKTGFTELVKVENFKVEGGFSIAIFCYAIHFLPFNVQPIFKPFINGKGESNGTYDELVQHIEGKTCEAVAGDVTIRANRAQNVDFTVPYMSSEVYMLVPAVHEWNQTLLTFLKPFTWKLWITIIGSCIFIGVGVSILEYRVNNPKFTVPLYQLPTMVIWFPISTFFFNEGKILNRNSKVVLVTWLTMIFIVVQIFTATLSSWLTLDQLRPKPSALENVGYQASFLKDILKQLNIPGKKNSLRLNSAEAYKNAFSNGGVDAIVDELPYIELFLAKYGSDNNYFKFGPLNQESGMAFAFPHGSRLLPFFSRAVIRVSESQIMMVMKKKYLRFSTVNYSSPPKQPPLNRLDVKSFIGLFIFVGIVTISAIISSEVSLRRANKKNQSSDSSRQIVLS